LRYMIIERFRNRDPVPVYTRFREQGRLAPDGLTYIESWVSGDLALCFQVMECEDPALIHQWIEGWSDLVDFEVFPVVTSAEAATRALAPDQREPS
jgi:hypothetical protein